MSRHARSEETKKRKREKEKERQKNKCEITEEHLECLYSILEKVEDGKPDFAKIAKGLMNEFDLQCSADFMRSVIKTKWEQWTGFGAMRRAVRDEKRVQNNADAEVLTIVEAQSTASALAEEEKIWQGKVIALFDSGRVPPAVELGLTSMKPSEIQENFRVKMLDYWSNNPSALKYSAPLEPASTGALDVLRFYKGHRDSRGGAVLGEGSILGDLEEIHKERAERKEKAKSAAQNAKATKQSSMLAFIKPSGDDVDCHLPNQPEEVSRKEVQIPPAPPVPAQDQVAWWVTQCGGSEAEVVSQTGFSGTVCEAIWMKYGNQGPLQTRVCK
eukprot:EG_transcript_19592